MTPVSAAKPTEAKVMVSNLPLLFAGGSPTSLESMCLEELQGFLRFVLKCELNLSNVDLGNLTQPQWWPKEVEWDESLLQRREQRGKTSTTLRAAIRACYTYHDCLYLLEFCRKLISYTGGIENLQVVDNRDGTRSLLNRGNKKLLVTFRAENQDYDKSAQTTSSTPTPGRGHKSLLPPSSRRTAETSRLRQLLNTSKTSDNTSDPSLTKCVEVSMCDNCDKDFDSLQELMAHELTCGKKEIICIDEGVSAKEAFLRNNFKLSKIGGKPPGNRKLKESQRPKAASYDKFMDIELSSPLGRYIITSSKLGLDVQNPASRGFKSVEEYIRELESRCPGTSRAFKSSNAAMDVKARWNITYRKKNNMWTHTYCFTAAQMEKRMRELRCGLTDEAMRLLKKCRRKTSKLKLKRLTDSAEGRELIDRVKRRYAEEHQQFLKEEAKKKEIERLKKLKKKPGDRDESSDATSVEEDTLENVKRMKNSFVKFENVGFRTNGSFVVQDEIVTPSFTTRPFRPAFTVPPSLPSLQKMAKPKVTKEVECVDLCSSDED